MLSSSITNIIAQAWNQDEIELSNIALNQRPRFGSFLKIDSTESSQAVYAVVYDVVTGPADTIHKPWALGLSREQLRSEQPHIFALLRTEIHAAIIGYSTAEHVYRHLPPLPPDVHDFVYSATKSEVIALTENFDFLRLLLTVSAVPTDELLAATIREAYRLHDGQYEFLVTAGQALSQLLHNDYERLVSLLRKIRPQ